MMSVTAPRREVTVPLLVDLDDTLTKTDLLLEPLLLLTKRRPVDKLSRRVLRKQRLGQSSRYRFATRGLSGSFLASTQLERPQLRQGERGGP